MVLLGVLWSVRNLWEAVNGPLRLWLWRVAMINEIELAPMGRVLGLSALDVQSVTMWMLCYFVPCWALTMVISFMVSRLLYRLRMIFYPARLADKSRAGLAYRYDLVGQVLRTVNACSTVHRAPDDQKESARRALSDALAQVEQAIRWAHHSRGTLSLRSPLHSKAKSHADRVIGRLRTADQQVDARGDGELRPLAELLLTIAERYLAGRVTSLLKKKTLKGAEPAKSREPLRLAAAAFLVAAGGVGIDLFGLPDVLKDTIFAAVVIIAITLLYRGAWVPRGFAVPTGAR
ncbi:hypothetical protein ABZ593_29860 [Streptomyces sp. NPDC012617]|uniref:hypothetical protein n=2 Tax=Streptomyces TaxID=1883 RepID=UPI0033CA331F